MPSRDPITGRSLDALLGCTLAFPPCGCTVQGAGTLPDPVKIVFCPMHEAAPSSAPAVEVRGVVIDAEDDLTVRVTVELEWLCGVPLPFAKFERVSVRVVPEGG